MQIEFSHIELFWCIVAIPLFGFAWNTITDDDNIMFWYWNFLNKMGAKNKFLYYISKPLGLCNVCLTGQIAFWFYIFSFNYSCIKHIFFTMISISIISLLNFITSWLLKS